MIFLALKIIRFLFGLVFKVLLLPVKLVKLAMGAQSDDSEYDTYDSDDPLSEDASTSDGLTGSSSIADSDPFDVDAATAARNLVWFRWGLFGIGALQLAISLFLLVEIASVPGGSGILMAVATIAVAASLPILAAVLLPRKPTAGWYLGMGLVTLQMVGSVFSLPQGILWLLVGAPLAYLGYTGRPAVDVIYGDGSRTETSTSAETDTTADPEPAAATDQIGGDDIDATGRTEPAESADASTMNAAATADGTATASSDSESENSADQTPYPESATAETDSDSAFVFDSESEADPASDPETDAATTADSETDAATTADSGGVVGRYRDELTADDPTVRADAVRELATAVESDSTPEQAVVDAIAERLDDDDAAVRSAACEALGSLGASRAKPYLRDRRIDPDPEVSRAASRALRNLE
jgi:hypothetical protein